jgi:adenylate kinase
MTVLKLVITGNPGVGKHTSAKIIAARTGAEIIDINRVAIDNSAIAKKTERGLDVDVKKLARLLAKLLKSRKDLVVVGHLAPYVVKPAGVSMVAVLRRSPYDLEKTLEKRGYSASKIKENLASEILGVSLYDSLKTFGKRKVAEFDTTGKTPDQTADEIMRALRKKPKPAGIDWLALVSERGDMQRFFEY